MFHEFQALVEFLLADHQWRGDPDDVRLGRVDQQTLGQGAVDDLAGVFDRRDEHVSTLPGRRRARRVVCAICARSGIAAGIFRGRVVSLVVNT